MVFTDGVHLTADSVYELQEFADSIGLKREWFQNNILHPHYDLTTWRKVLQALDAGAYSVHFREMPEIANLIMVSGRTM